MSRWRMIWQIIKNAIRHILLVMSVTDIEELMCTDASLRAEMEAWDKASAEALSAFPYVLDDNSIETPSAGAGRRR